MLLLLSVQAIIWGAYALQEFGHISLGEQIILQVIAILFNFLYSKLY